MTKVFGFLGIKGLCAFFSLGISCFLVKEVIGWLTGIHFFLIGIFLLGFLFMFRMNSFYLQKRYGSRVVCFMYISLMFLTSLFCYSCRVYLGFFVSDVLTVVIGTWASVEVHQHGGGGPENSSGWTNFDLNVLAESMPETESGGGSPSTNAGPSEPSVNQAPPSPSGERDRDSSVEQPVLPQPPVGPANPIPPVEPYPYADNQRIGGDSVHAIQQRLLITNMGVPSAEEIYRAHIEAQDLFEVKAVIYAAMGELEPSRDWSERGAWALENPHTASGEQPLERLCHFRDDLILNKENSETFKKLRDKVPLRR